MTAHGLGHSQSAEDAGNTQGEGQQPQRAESWPGMQEGQLLILSYSIQLPPPPGSLLGTVCPFFSEVPTLFPCEPILQFRGHGVTLTHSENFWVSRPKILVHEHG